MRHLFFHEAEDGRIIAMEDGFVVNSPCYDALADPGNPDRHTPESLVECLRGLSRRSEAKTDESGVVLLRTSSFDSPQARYSFVAAKPFLTFRSFGSCCEISCPVAADVNLRTSTTNNSPPTHVVSYVQFGNPWQILDALLARCELLDEIDLPFPLGGCFGYWGYDLKNFVGPKLPRRAINDLELPDCHACFYDSLVVFDHHLGKTFVISPGLAADGSRCEKRAGERMEFWKAKLGRDDFHVVPNSSVTFNGDAVERVPTQSNIVSNLSRADFFAAVERAQHYIRAGDIYQVNLSQRLTVELPRCDKAADERFCAPATKCLPNRKPAAND